MLCDIVDCLSVMHYEYHRVRNHILFLMIGMVGTNLILVSAFLFQSNGHIPSVGRRRNPTNGARVSRFPSMLHNQRPSLQEIKDRVDITIVIEDYGLPQFRRTGPDRATALCPFHDDRNPSLSISRQRYKCFACDAGGDVYRFVQEYETKVKRQPTTFGQAVQYVLTNYYNANGATPVLSTSQTPQQTRDGSANIKSAKNPSVNTTASSKNTVPLERLRLAHTLAAAFYLRQLAQPQFGYARAYLMDERSISAATARAFGLGVASRNKNALCEHLVQRHNFTISELLQTGLVVAKQPDSAERNNETNSLTYVRDRFRDRLMVPIWDSSGQQVIAFGGRTLMKSTTTNSKFQPPKYLNSPETALFTKRKVLFGRHLVERQSLDAKHAFPVVVVEGYMDAIVLHSAGYQNVVASMGTGISTEQLDGISRLGSATVVFCLDNDEAGQNAMERLCSNGFLRNQGRTTRWRVATFPVQVKDPADLVQDYFEENGRDGFPQYFKTTILDRAEDWITWYTNRLLQKYDVAAPRGAPESFGGIFEQSASFMANSLSAADRAQCSFEISQALAEILAKERNGEGTESIRSQLEADLLDSSSRLALEKEALVRRAEAVGIETRTSAVSVQSTLASGGGPESLADISASKLAFNSTRKLREPPTVSNSQKRSSRQTRWLGPGGTREETSLTPHFGGFEFAHETDVDWLNLPKQKKQQHQALTLAPRRRKSRRGGNDYLSDPSRLTDSNVYFGSNQYHGGRFLTEEAASAGYTRSSVPLDPELFVKGLGVILKQDVDAKRWAAEEALLRCLVCYKATRSSVFNSLDARRAVYSTVQMRFSTLSRQWLFETLVKPSSIPATVKNSTELLSFLSSLEECPSEAFYRGDSVAPNESFTTEQSSFLDYLFVPSKYASIEKDLSYDQAESFALSSLYEFMWASSACRLRELETELGSWNGDSNPSPETASSASFNQSATVLQDLKGIAASNPLLEELCALVSTLDNLAASSKRIQSDIVTSSSHSGREGAISRAEQKRFAEKADDILQTVLNHPAEDTDSADEKDQIWHKVAEHKDSETYEDALDRMAQEWGQLYDDDVFWSPDLVKSERNTSLRTQVEMLPPEEDDHPESLQEALDRMDREWGRLATDHDVSDDHNVQRSSL